MAKDERKRRKTKRELGELYGGFAKSERGEKRKKTEMLQLRWERFFFMNVQKRQEHAVQPKSCVEKKNRSGQVGSKSAAA